MVLKIIKVIDNFLLYSLISAIVFAPVIQENAQTITKSFEKILLRSRSKPDITEFDDAEHL